MADVETRVAPPEPAADDDGDWSSARLSVTFSEVNGALAEASMQLFGADCEDPDKLANALLGAALALAHLRGPDFAWSVQARFAAYTGGGVG